MTRERLVNPPGRGVHDEGDPKALAYQARERLVQGRQLIAALDHIGLHVERIADSLDKLQRNGIPTNLS